MEQEFEWDENKNHANRQRHGIAFEEAQEIFGGLLFTAPDMRMEYGEERFISIGLIAKTVVIVVIHTDRNGKVRIISARKANRKERQAYHEHLERTRRTNQSPA